MHNCHNQILYVPSMFKIMFCLPWNCMSPSVRNFGYCWFCWRQNHFLRRACTSSLASLLILFHFWARNSIKHALKWFALLALLSYKDSKKKVRPINLLFEFDVVACWDSSKLVVLFVSLIPSIRIAFFRSFNLNFFFPWPKRKQEKRLPCLAYKKVCRDLLMS